MAKKLSIKKKEWGALAETFRRLFYFKKGNVNTDLLLLANMSEAKELKERGIIEASTTESRGANWYRLTNKGKSFFNLLSKKEISSEENHKLFCTSSLPYEVERLYTEFITRDLERAENLKKYKESKIQ